jgi:hypothetical protein
MENDNLMSRFGAIFAFKPTKEEGRYAKVSLLPCKRCKNDVETIFDTRNVEDDWMYSEFKKQWQSPSTRLAQRQDICPSCQAEIEEEMFSWE